MHRGSFAICERRIFTPNDYFKALVGLMAHDAAASKAGFWRCVPCPDTGAERSSPPQLSCADGLLAFGRAVFFLSHFQPQNGPVASGAQTPVGGEF
jgi:hypothetical protein